MKPSTVQKFGIFIIILSIIASLVIFLGIFFALIFLILGLPFGWAYNKQGKISKKVNKFMCSSVWVSAIASILMLANLILTIFIVTSYSTRPGSENYTHIILFSLASVPIAALYIVGLLLMVLGWESKDSQNKKIQ